VKKVSEGGGTFEGGLLVRAGTHGVFMRLEKNRMVSHAAASPRALGFVNSESRAGEKIGKIYIPSQWRIFSNGVRYLVEGIFEAE